MHTHTALLALTLATGTTLAADDFARLAPPEAGLIVSVADYTRAKDRLLATPIGRLTETPDIKAALDEARAESMKALEELTGELGIDIEEWPEPAGMVGLAIIARPIPDADEWSPQFEQLFVAAADFGDRIGEIQSILDAVVDQGLDQGLIEVQVENVGDVEVITFTHVEQEIPDEDADDFSFDQPSGLSGLLSGLGSGTVAIDGSTLYIGAEAELVMDMLDRARGADTPSIADDGQFAGAIAQHEDEPTEYAVIFPGRMGFVEGFAQGLGFFMPPGLEAAQMLTDLGITNVKAISLSANLEPAGDAQAEFTLGVLDNEKSGLVSLLDLTGEPWNPPSFATPDAMGATRLLVDFNRLPDVAREFFGTLPADLRDQAGMMFEQAMGFVDSVAPLLGPEVYIIQTLQRPFGPESASQVFAIATSDELPISNLLVMASQGAGLMPRDFGSTKIYEADGSPALAVAYGHVFIGTTAGVESALRLAAADAGESLASDEAFQSAMRPHESTGNAVQFTRLVDMVEYTIWAAQNAQAIALQQLRAAGWTEEDIAQYGPSADDTPEWLKNLTIDTLAPALGDVSMEVSPSSDGFRGRILFHNPR